MRVKITILVVVVLIVLVGVSVIAYVVNSNASSSSVGTRPQAKQASSSAESSATSSTRSASQSGNSAPPRATAAPTATAVTMPVSSKFVAKATGNLISANQATLAFQSSGRIKDIKVKEGDRVKAGDVLASLDTSALDANVVQAQSALDSAAANLAKVKAGPTADDLIIAKTTLDRARITLQQAQAAYDIIAWRSDFGMSAQAIALQTATDTYQASLAQFNQTINHPTDAELKAAQATYAQAQASLETAKVNASNARITAPFDGTVVWIGIKLGESSTTGTGAITIAELGKMQVQVNIDEISSGAIKVGQLVSITLDSVPGKAFTGSVPKVGLLASTTSNIVSIPVTIDIDNSNVPIYPGLSATVEFQARAQ